MAIQLKNSSNTIVYEFPRGCNIIEEPWSKRQDSEPRAYQQGVTRTGDEKIEERIISLHGIFNVDSVNSTYGATIILNLREMKQQCNTENLRLYPGSQYTDEYYDVECLNFEHRFVGKIGIVEIDIEFQVVKPFRNYKDATTDTSYLSESLSLNGSGYASIADGSQSGLDMGLSDFMLGIWIKTSSTAIFPIIYKSGAGGYYDLHLNATTGYLECKLYDGTDTVTITGDVALNDGNWHLVRTGLDKSSATGGRLYADGAEDTSAQTDITSIDNIDNDGIFYIGYDGSNYGTGQYDEPEIFNFGYGGLPGDVAAYDTWRYANPFADLSDYDSGGWSEYADADRSELVTNGDMELDANWIARGTPTTEVRSNEQANNGTYSWKIISDATGEGAYQDITTVVNKWYEVTGYVYVTAGDVKLGKEDTDGSDQVLTGQATAASWNEFNVIFKATETTSRIFFQSDATAASTFYVDDVTVKRTGLVSHYKLNDDYTDETANSNDLTAGGTGNSFVLANLPDGTVTNGGDENVYPVITFTGGTDTALTKLKIENAEDGGKYFEVTVAIGNADVIEIDCLEGTCEKNGSSIMSSFSGAWIKLASGSNTISFTLTGTTGYCTNAMVFRKKYL